MGPSNPPSKYHPMLIRKLKVRRSHCHSPDLLSVIHVTMIAEKKGPNTPTKYNGWKTPFSEIHFFNRVTVFEILK